MLGAMKNLNFYIPYDLQRDLESARSTQIYNVNCGYSSFATLTRLWKNGDVKKQDDFFLIIDMAVVVAKPIYKEREC
jgi:hypothetical protein